MSRGKKFCLGAATLIIVFGVSLAISDQAAYVGSGKCKPCHFKQYDSWSKSKMANAFDLLLPNNAAEAKTKAGLDPKKDYSTDQKCLKCHVTGLGQPGGFTSADATPALKGVGCEMCHGAGASYMEVMKKNAQYKKAEVTAAGLVSPPTKEMCIKCHNTESPFVGKDYVFDFEKRKAQGTHEHFPLKNAH